MLYRIKFISEEVDGFFRELLIESDGTFLDLNEAVLAACNYSDDQMTSFYVCDNEWERGVQITREDVSDPDNEEEDVFLMERTPLSEFINEEGQRLEYVFDPFSCRSFFLQVKEIITGRHLEAAELVREGGEPPVQLEMPVEEPVAPKGKKAKADENYIDDEELFFGDKSFNSEDFDPEGFEITEDNF